MYILGISAFYHDSAAALIGNGEIIAAAQEERFSRIKHDNSFPSNAIQYCLNEANITVSDIDYLGFYENPVKRLNRLIATYLSYAPSGYQSFKEAFALSVNRKIQVNKILNRFAEFGFKGKIFYSEHHQSHAASAFYPSPFQKAAILTIDGVGEWATTTIGKGTNNRLILDEEIRFPHSLGLLYSAFTYYTGFKVNSGEYKLMGLAPYGEPKYVDLILNKLIKVQPDGSFWMNMKYFNYCQGLTMVNSHFESLFGQARRIPEQEIKQFHMDIAASIQRVTEKVMLSMADHLYKNTKCKNLCLSGGVALNCVGNGKILEHSRFENIWIQPAAGDAGSAIGAAMYIWYQMLGRTRINGTKFNQQNTYLGPQFDDSQVRDYLDAIGAIYDVVDDDEKLCECVSDFLIKGKVVGWFQGRMEFGPRALGNRSILGDARSPKMQKILNLKIKFRESFRPFAPSVLIEDCHKYFALNEGQESPYMLLVAPVNPERRISIQDKKKLNEVDKLSLPRSEIPAVTHVDYSARIHTVSKSQNSLYYKLIQSFKKKTGCSVIVNTSFNVRGEPIVCSPYDAYGCFMATNMDILVIGHCLLKKENQQDIDFVDQKSYLEKFNLD